MSEHLYPAPKSHENAPPKQTVLTNRETAIQGHSKSSVVAPIDAAYMTSYYHAIVT